MTTWRRVDRPVAQGPMRRAVAMTSIHRLRSRTLGVVGLGRIGRRLAAKGRALELRVLGSDPVFGPAEAAAVGIDWRPLPDLLAESDFVSLHAPLVEATEGMIGRTELARFKPGAYLINVSRGGLVDEPALLEALERRQLAGAGLDVLAIEPAPSSHPLIGHPRVVITPHSARSGESRRAAPWWTRGTEPDGLARCRASQSGTRRRRSALPITETELNVIAALATMGLRRRPSTG